MKRLGILDHTLAVTLLIINFISIHIGSVLIFLSSAALFIFLLNQWFNEKTIVVSTVAYVMTITLEELSERPAMTVERGMEIFNRKLKERKIQIKWTKKVCEELLKKCSGKDSGARAIRQIIREEILLQVYVNVRLK